MAVSWDTPGLGGEMGRIRGQKGTYYGKYEGLETNLPEIKRPPLPPGVEAGGHGGSHGQLMNEFVVGDPGRPQTAGRHRPGAEHDRVRDRGARVGSEGRRDHEDPAIHVRLGHRVLPVLGS